MSGGVIWPKRANPKYSSEYQGIKIYAFLNLKGDFIKRDEDNIKFMLCVILFAGFVIFLSMQKYSMCSLDLPHSQPRS